MKVHSAPAAAPPDQPAHHQRLRQAAELREEPRVRLLGIAHARLQRLRALQHLGARVAREAFHRSNS